MELVLSLSALFLAIILHEIAHGYVAFALGDDTAKRAGRLSLNPVKHIDPTGTIAVPLLMFFSNIGFVFGWAKPVPVNYRNLKSLKRDIILVSSAGIVTNLILAFVSAFIIKLTLPTHNPMIESFIIGFLTPFVFYNIVLAVFNMIPIPPLDGSKIIFTLIDKPWGYKFLDNDRMGFGIIILIGFILPFFMDNFGIDFDIFGSYIKTTTQFIVSLLP